MKEQTIQCQLKKKDKRQNTMQKTEDRATQTH